MSKIWAYDIFGNSCTSHLHGNHYTPYLEDTAAIIKKGHVIKTGLTLHKIYSITFDVYFTQFLFGKHENIIRLTNTDGNCCNPGDRIMGVWIDKTKSDSSKQLYIALNDMDGTRNYFITKTSYSLNQWIHVDVRQVLRDGSFFHIVTIDNKIEYEKKNKQPQDHENVIVYTSDTFFDAAVGMIQNINITSG